MERRRRFQIPRPRRRRAIIPAQPHSIRGLSTHAYIRVIAAIPVPQHRAFAVHQVPVHREPPHIRSRILQIPRRALGSPGPSKTPRSHPRCAVSTPPHRYPAPPQARPRFPPAPAQNPFRSAPFQTVSTAPALAAYARSAALYASSVVVHNAYFSASASLSSGASSTAPSPRLELESNP